MTFRDLLPLPGRVALIVGDDEDEIRVELEPIAARLLAGRLLRVADVAELLAERQAAIAGTSRTARIGPRNYYKRKGVSGVAGTSEVPVAGNVESEARDPGEDGNP
jgi:hypothetical protein